MGRHNLRTEPDSDPGIGYPATAGTTAAFHREQFDGLITAATDCIASARDVSGHLNLHDQTWRDVEYSLVAALRYLRLAHYGAIRGPSAQESESDQG